MKQILILIIYYLFVTGVNGQSNDTLFIYLNPSICVAVRPSFEFIEQEATKRNQAISFVLEGVRRKDCINELQEFFFTERKDFTCLLPSDRKSLPIHSNHLMIFESSHPDKIYYSFEDYYSIELVQQPIKNKQDTICFDEKDLDFNIPAIGFGQDNDYFLIQSNGLIAHYNEQGSYIKHVELQDSIVEILYLAALNNELIEKNIPFSQLSSIYEAGLKKNRLNPELALSFKFLDEQGVHLMAEINDISNYEKLDNDSMLVIFKKYTYYLLCDKNDFSILKANRLDMIYDSVGFKRNANFYDSKNGLIYLNLFPYYTPTAFRQPNTFPTVAVFELDNNDRFVLKRTTDNELPQRYKDIEYGHGMLNYKFIKHRNQMYGLDEITSTMYKVDDNAYEFVLPDLPQESWADLMKSSKLKSVVSTFWDKGDYLCLLVSKYLDDDFLVQEREILILDMDAKKLIERKSLGFMDATPLSGVYLLSSGKMYNVFVNKEDKLCLSIEPIDIKF